MSDEHDDMIMLQLLQQTNLANGSTGNTFVFCFESDLLQSYDLIGADIASLVHDTIRS